MRIHILLVAGALVVSSGCTVRTYTRPATVSYSAAYQGSVSYSQPSYVYVQQPPPPLQPAIVNRPPPPVHGAIWVDGHYAYNGGGWIWVSGSWQTPQPGHVWQPPVCVTAPNGGYQYHPGYWRPQAQQPAPVYRQRGTVRVSVRPSYEPYQPSGHVVVNQTPTHHPQYRPQGTVQVQGRPTGTVTVQQGGTVHQPARPTNNVTVQGRPGATVTVQGQPTHQGGVTVQTRPAQPTTTVRPNSNVTVQRPGATVTVQGRPAQQGGVTVQNRPTAVHQGGVTVHQQGRPANAVSVQGRPGNSVTVQGRPGNTVTVQGQPTAVHQGGVTTHQQPNVQHQGGVTVQAQGNQLRCRVSASRVRRGSTFNISGNGFGAQTSVRVGGQVAAVVNRTGGNLRVQMPVQGNGGIVSVVTNNRSATCGSVTAY